ncbi:NADH-dependent flavin oxidoreductase [Falsibacillus albus]|uniref:NADH-dependent flavin oxidoreductase n=1 Tax=Falsibacillus albus TaxID=2478915 RepID=A0A3L7JZN7_9BACI|nr:NADH-dependent flavin oxidoreductase [Falsibacillus albus]RLQ96328.1 NADH-dependent flavin oxidoreductase [Falsibacillus albus]
MNSIYKPLFEDFQFQPSGINQKNRIVMAPMTNFLSNSDGTVSDAELRYYARRSNGPGMVITACAYVSRSGKGFPGEFGADSDEMVPSLKRLAETIKGKGAKAVLQIFHGGRECPPDLVPDGDVVSAGTIKSTQNGSRKEPRALTTEETEKIVHDFAEATRRAIEAGFDGVEIHGANGYLIQQFYSPNTNQRDDKWGGSLQKRMAFPLAIVDAIKKTVVDHAKGSFLVGYRFSPEEPETSGITMTETFALIDELAKKNLDYLHVSVMNFWSKARRGANGDKARVELIQERVGANVPVIGVGSIYSANDAMTAIESGVPLIALGRELIIDPDWVEKVEQGREDEIETKLDLNAQERLVVPDPLWKAIINTPGWFPGVE